MSIAKPILSWLREALRALERRLTDKIGARVLANLIDEHDRRGAPKDDEGGTR